MRNYLVVCLLSHCFSKHIRGTNFIYVVCPPKSIEIYTFAHAKFAACCNKMNISMANEDSDGGGSSSLIQFSSIFRNHAASIYERSESIVGFAEWHTNYRIINVVASIFLLEFYYRCTHSDICECVFDMI